MQQHPAQPPLLSHARACQSASDPACKQCEEHNTPLCAWELRRGHFDLPFGGGTGGGREARELSGIFSRLARLAPPTERASKEGNLGEDTANALSAFAFDALSFTG